MLTAKKTRPSDDTLLHAFGRSMRKGMGQRIGSGLAMLALASSLYSPVAMGQVITDPRAPIQFKPTIGKSANGTPVVDIAKPSFGGISHNKFQRYDVDTRGLILNNSKLTGTSLIGGKVVANPNLAADRPARVILNEVTSTDASTLNGTTEVFGTRADVIVANPNGVACNGCSFANSGRVTLSTGRPLPDYRRGTVKFDVGQGSVSVNGAGLLGMGEILSNVDLIGRQLKINGPIQTKEGVRLRAGGMVYDQRADTAAAKAQSEILPVTGPAIQSGSTGKITAGTLSVLSRDLDLGIQLDGDLAANAGSIAIRSYGDVSMASATAQGDIQLNASGQIQLVGNSTALGRIVASANRIEVALDKELVANDTIVFEALQSLSTRGILKAGKAISLVSGGKLVAEGLIAANGEIAFEGRSFTSKGLRVSGQSVSIAGLEGASLENTEIVATKDSVKVGSLAIELGEGTVFQAGDRIVVDAKDTLTNGTSLNYTNLDLSVRNAFTNTATGLLVLDHILLNTRDAVTNAGIIYGRIDAKLSVGSLTNTSTGVINGPEIVLTVANGLTNLGQILSERTFKLIAGDIVNDGTIQSGTELTLNAKSYRANSIAAVLVGATTELVLTEAVENSGQILGINRLTIGAEGSIINNGAIQTEGQLTVRGQNYFSAATSILTSRKADVIALGDFENRGQILASQKLTVESLGLRNLGVASSITGANVTLIAHHDALNEGTIGAITGVSIDSGGNLLSPGSIAVGGTAPANLDADATGEAASC